MEKNFTMKLAQTPSNVDTQGITLVDVPAFGKVTLSWSVPLEFRLTFFLRPMPALLLDGTN